jgi:hypothetical protein
VFSKLSQCPDLRFAIGRVRLGTIPVKTGTFCWHPNVARLFQNQAQGRPSGRAASRTCRANSWASGLSVLFFNVTSASGLAVNGKSIGRALSSRCFGGKRMTTRRTMDKKRSLSRSDREGVR